MYCHFAQSGALRLLTFCLRTGLLLLSLFGLPAVQAATSSLPSYSSTSGLHIPRIDVQSLGSLEVTMELVDSKLMVFGIADADPAAATATPGATYNNGSGVLDIPVLRVGTKNYSAKLQAVANNRFQVTSVQAIALPGENTYLQMCANCHGADGRGGAIGVSLLNCKWCGNLTSLTNYIDGSMPLGNPGSCNATCSSELANYLLTVFNTPNVGQTTRTLDALILESSPETLRRVALQLVSRLPTATEAARVNVEGAAGLRAVINGMMDEPAFYERLDEIFNDWLHTNRYLSMNGSEAAIGLMGNFPTARWYDTGGTKDAAYTQNQLAANNSVATEPLELINYVARHNLPATEILTADYMMVNGYSAKSYGIKNVTFTNEWDPKEFKPAQLTNIPHAGVLTSLMFLNRYPTTATNRNRARSRVVYDLFLDVDILGLDGVRPNGAAVDIKNTAPTMENPDCTKCHSLLDPVASAFQNWSARGTYSVPRTWYGDMFQAGFAGVSLPVAAKSDQTGWLAEQIAADPRFDTAMVRLLYRGLTGIEPLRAPGATATTVDVEAYQAEAQVLNGIKAVYVADGRKLKTLVREIVMSSYWRADGLNNNSFALVHSQTGSARLLTPELLHRKIKALLGFEWRGPLDSYSNSIINDSTARLLNSRQYYQQLYGGIDSLTVTERLTDPNGLMVKVQERMANELACYAVPNDFLAESSARRLLPHVETSTLVTPQNTAAIKTNLQHLHRYLLGEELPLESAELAYTYELFVTVLADGRNKITAKTESSTLPTLCRRTKGIVLGQTLGGGGLVSDPNYTIRAWTAVVAYLLSDYRFLYE